MELKEKEIQARERRFPFGASMDTKSKALKRNSTTTDR
jgi:hypothetical protein